MKSNIQLKYSNNVAFSQFHGCAVNNLGLYYYSTENSTGEIDFMIQHSCYCIPIEVKAEENLKARSLKAFCDKFSPDVAIRTSMSNYRKQDWLCNVPLYALVEYIRRID